MKRITLLFVAVFAALSSMAQDRQFIYTYQSLTLPKGTKDVEVWNTYRTGRKYLYNRLDQRIEFEVGVTDKLQTALYFNAEHKLAQTHLDTLGGIPDTAFYGLYSESAFSFSSEWKLKLSDPVANRIGSALYAELTLGAAEIELEGKLILDKKTDKNIIAMNLVGEYETEFEAKPAEKEIEAEHEFKPEVDLAYMRLLKPNLGIGLEARYTGVIVDGEMEHSALFGGPTFFFNGDKFFMILSASPQIMNLQVNDQNPESLDMTEYEKYQFRLLLGLNF